MPKGKFDENLIENLSAPEVYASNVAFFAHSSEVVSISFASQRWDGQTRTTKRVIVGRLVMPISGAQEFAARLVDYLGRQKLGLATQPLAPKQLQ